MGKHISDDLYRQIVATKQANPDMGRGTLAQKCGCTERKIRTALNRMKREGKKPIPGKTGRPHTQIRQTAGMTQIKPAEEIEVDYQDVSAIITTKSLNIRTAAQALAAAKVDMNIWEIARQTVGSSEVTMGMIKTGTGKPETYTNFAIKVWLRRKDPTMIAMEALTNRLEKAAPKWKAIARKPMKDPCLLEVCIFDHHFGMLAWREETHGDYDLKIAEDFYLRACEQLINRARGYNIERIVFPLGQDFFHINDASLLTPGHKNKLDVDGRYAKVFEAGKMAVLKAIAMCRKIAPVDVIYVPGNHDMDSAYCLTQVLWGYFHNDPEVTVDVSACFRKHILYGINFIGYAHGTYEPVKDLPRIFMDNFTDDWAKAINREIHVGHKHKKTQTSFLTTETYGSTTVRMIPSLCATDAYHYEHGYVGKDKAAESFLWHKERGQIASFLTHIDLED